jgi:O-antigen/teichoic acid export membrane protein
MALYVGLLPAVLRETTFLAGVSLRRLRVSVRGVLAYTLPLLSTDLVLAIMGSIDALVLGFTHGTEAVGSLRVVESAARANALVFTAFGTLFVPVAARYMARGDRPAMHDLYWRTAAWIAVLSFPIFALTFSLADSITVLLYEERYRASAVFLAILSLGRFIDAALGANGQTLRLFGSTKAVVGVNLFAAGAHLILAVLLIPPFGALGAAFAVLLTFIVYNGAKQVMLQRAAGIPLFDLHYLPIYRAIALGVGAVAAFDIVVQPPLVVSLAVAGLASLAVLRSSARLRIHETFPELSRIPLMKFLR